MRLVQFLESDGARRVGLVHEGTDRLELLAGTERVHGLALDAIAAGRGLADLAAERASGESVAYGEVAEARRLLSPLDHPDPAHCYVTGTGLTHLGSADARDRMHKKAAEEGEESLTDSMKMFKWGLDGGKPEGGGVGVQPEWFYKGDGSALVGSGQPLAMPAFALDGGEEPEVTGLYVVAPDGTPWRVGYALGNEFSDHVLERQNYLYLAHSKLRACAVGPELLIGDLPGHIEGRSRVLRGETVLWEASFLTGEDNMSHSLFNLEHHHFKYPLFRRPGDAHVHFFGATTLSFAAGIRAQAGDVFEISAPPFGRPLANPLAVLPEEEVAPRGL
jgi:hypothetical protein